MLKPSVENTMGRLLATGVAFCSMFLLTSSVTDPVNSTKLWVTSGLGVGVLAISIVYGLPTLKQHFRSIVGTLLIFNICTFWASINSKSPFTQNYFGTYGRNTGFLTYVMLSMVFLGALLISSYKSFTSIWKGFLFTGIVNFAYCSWVLLFGDFLGWNNPYKSILGLFGNPDFISAFLGMFITGVLAYVFAPGTETRWRTVGLLIIPISLFEIVKSHAIQGLVVTAGGLALVLFFKLRSVTSRRIYTLSFLALVIGMGLVAILGTLQKGPLKFVYKRSVSFRGTYWHAGIKMGENHPITGIGMDSYGDWYRRARPPIALIDTPGKSVMSNVSHNVVVDLFASGGFPLLVAYLASVILTGAAIVRILKRSREYEFLFVGMTAVWICYEVQSFISINQIGLAVWGWLFGGLLIAYEVSTRDKSASKPEKFKSTKNLSPISPNLVAGIGILVGLLIGFPPFNADTKWASAMKQHDAALVEKVLTPTLFNPADSQKYGMAVELFANSQLGDLAHKYALKAVNFNPDNFDAWYQLYTLSNSTPQEKSLSLSNMKRLDPLNPDVTVR